jgi:hypothetical protein
MGGVDGDEIPPVAPGADCYDKWYNDVHYGGTINVRTHMWWHHWNRTGFSMGAHSQRRQNWGLELAKFCLAPPGMTGYWGRRVTWWGSATCTVARVFTVPVSGFMV